MMTSDDPTKFWIMNRLVEPMVGPRGDIRVAFLRFGGSLLGRVDGKRIGHETHATMTCHDGADQLLHREHNAGRRASRSAPWSVFW
jgi:hypothetical protein